MITGNTSFLLTLSVTPESIASPMNATNELYDTSSSSTIITIAILSFLSIAGWIFMSYALFNRSEAYRTKPDDQHGVSHYMSNSDSSPQNGFMADLD
jgi:Kef-type K+ transport system membrane component KefB